MTWERADRSGAAGPEKGYLMTLTGLAPLRVTAIAVACAVIFGPAALVPAGCAARAAGVPVFAARPAGPVTAYVVNYNSDTVTPIRTATNTALKPIKTGRQPENIAITP
jgi:YVTN family beta-propeller protein